jgi:hypothetical protein
MKDWNGIVVASGLGIPADEVGRIAKPLDSLEAAFRPLTASLTFADEPAAIFDPSEDAE